MRYLYALMGILLLLAALAAAGSFEADMDVDTYVNANDADQSHGESDLLWVTSEKGTHVNETYLSFVNFFGSQSIFRPEQIKSAKLTLDAARVEKAGKVKAYFFEGAIFNNVNWSDKAEYDINVSSAAVEIEEEGSYELNVTAIIQKAVESCTEGCPYSIILVAEDDASVGFTSSEASDEDMPTLEYVT